MTALNIWIKRIFCFCFIAFFTVLLCLHGIGLGLLLAAAAVWLPRRFRIPHFLPLLFAASTLVHLVAIFAIQTPVISDFQTMYHAAQRFSVGDYTFQNASYFFNWAYQTGFVIWEGLLLRLCNSVLFLKIVNALLLSGINCMIYLLARRFADERAAQSAALLYLVTAFPTLMTCVLTNQHVSAFFMILGLLVLTGGKKPTIPRAVLSGILLALGNIMRPEAIVLLAGLCGTAVFLLLMRRRVRGSGPMLRGIAVAVILYAVCMAGTSWAVSASGINQYGLSNNWPQWKFITGFNYDTGGMYSSDDADTFSWAHQTDTTDSDAATAKAVENQLIHDRIFISPVRFGSLMVRKAYNLWIAHGLGFPLGHINNDSSTAFGITGTKIYQYFIQLDRTVFLTALLLALLGVAVLWRRRPEKLTFSAVLPPMTVLAFAAVFLLIEVQARYVYLPQIFLYITAAAGLAPVHERLVPPKPTDSSAAAEP